MRRTAALAMFLALSACATELAPGAESVQVVTPSQKEHLCKSLGIFTVEKRTGPNKSGSAMNLALNEAYRRGGNGIYPISNSLDWAEGASVTAEALKCQFK